MDSECDDWLFGDLFTKNGMTMEELRDYVLPILKDDRNEMNQSCTAVNLDDGRVSVAPAEPETLQDDHPEQCEGSNASVRNEPCEFATENRLPSMVSTQQASHAEENSSIRDRAPVAKRKKQKTRNNVVSDNGTQVVKRRCRWSVDEHERFLWGLQKYGKSHWKDIANKAVRTRTPPQVASHAQKHSLRQIQANKMRSSINDVSVELKPSECLPDSSESSSAAARRQSGRPANNIPDPRYGTVRFPQAVMQPSPIHVRQNFNTVQSSSSAAEQWHSGRPSFDIPDPRYGMVRSPLAAMQSSSVPVRQNFNVNAPQHIPAQRNPANVLEGERNFGVPIQRQHLQAQYYPPITMQLPTPQHLPAKWNPNNFPGGGNFWPVRSPSMELPYYPVTSKIFPGIEGTGGGNRVEVFGFLRSLCTNLKNIL